MTEDHNREANAHPLVGLLFWVLGKDLHGGSSRDSVSDELSHGSPAIDTPDTLGSSDGRVLSWKDDNPDEKLVTWHEFADVKAPDVPLAEGATRLSSSLKPGGTMLARKKVGVEGERNFSEEDLNRRSPNSDQWGLFVSLTPPMECYSANQKQSGNPNIAEAKR